MIAALYIPITVFVRFPLHQINNSSGSTNQIIMNYIKIKHLQTKIYQECRTNIEKVIMSFACFVYMIFQ